MKEDAGAVMLKATEATGVGLDRLNLGVVALGYGVGDRMCEVSQDVGEVSFERLGNGLDLGEAGGGNTAKPLGEKVRAPRCVRLSPKLERNPEGGGASFVNSAMQATGALITRVLGRIKKQSGRNPVMCFPITSRPRFQGGFV